MVQQPNDLRRYHILAAGSWPAQPSTTVRIESETLPTGEAGGRHSLGVVVFAVGWRGLSAPTWLLPLQVAVIAIAAGLFALALAVAGAPSWLRAALLIMLVAILLAMRHSDSGFTHRGNAVLMTFALIAFLAATFPFLLAIYTALRLSLPQLRALLRDWRLPAIALTIVVPMALPLAQPYVESMLRGDPYPHPYWQVLSNSAAPADYLRPNPYHSLWGDWARRLYGRQGAEFYVAVGFTATALALAGLLAARRRREAWALATALALAAVMSLGPELRLPGGGSVALPIAYIYDRAPVWGDIRNWSRMGMYVALCAALLASLALTALPGQVRRFAWVFAAALVLLESATAWPLSPTAPRPVDVWLREQPGQGAFVQIPRPPGGYSHYLTLLTGKPTSQGTGKYTPALNREERDTLYDFPDESSLRLAQRWGIVYIVVLEEPMDRDAPGWREILAAQPLATVVYRHDGVSVYQIRGRVAGAAQSRMVGSSAPQRPSNSSRP